MEKILGIDYGLKKVGLAVSVGTLASPLKVIRYSSLEQLVIEIKQTAEKENIEVLVVGVSEGKSAESARKFGGVLAEELNLPVNFVDETLSTQDVQRLTQEAGMKRKKRKEMEDAFAAALILQSYLDSR